jgi:3-phenylpropionate/trans-cinnamate dioxygenase ferredoxin subunit
MVSHFIKACAESEIEEGKTKVVLIENRPLILVKDGGDIYAVEGICSHDGGEFGADEKVIDGQIECPRHGARFDIKTGEATRMPAIVGINRFDVRIEDGDIYVAIDE